jgi:hypothetical protein
MSSPMSTNVFPETYYSTVKMEAARSFKTLVLLNYQTTRCHIPEECNGHNHCRGNLNSRRACITYRNRSLAEIRLLSRRNGMIIFLI